MSQEIKEPHGNVILPSQPTPFIGRGGELAEISRLLHKRNCHLLTLLGPGGIGKTRLAVQAGALQAGHYKHGVYFVDLQPVNSVEFLVSAVTKTIGFPLTGQEDLIDQLCQYLKGKNLLLILDNFEQLLPQQGGLFLARLLDATPHVQLLVTSREALNLQEEWLFVVSGLSLPETAQADARARAESVQLFYERARRARSDFSPSAELTDVAQICRLVEGVPLALELAASWTRMLSCRQIADELTGNFDLLATNRQNVPDRQQSLRYIFDQTWQQLNNQERNVFKKLSIFRGGFTREAAGQVANASLPLLADLQDKSLIRWDENGRFRIHELLRQYAAERLAESPTELAQNQQAHCRYFIEFLGSREVPLMDNRQVQAVKEIDTELENVRLAWQWAVTNRDSEAIRHASFTLGNFYQFQSRYAEALKAFETASEELAAQPDSKERDLALINTLMVRSWFYLRFGRLDEIMAVMQQSQSLHLRHNLDPGPGYVTDPGILLAFAHLTQGHFDQTIRHAEQVCQTSERLNQPGNREFAYFLLAQAALAQGHYDESQTHARQAYAISLDMGDRWFMAYILNTLADLAIIKQDYAAARQYCQSSFDIRQEFNDVEGMAVALNHLSDIALRQKNYPAARDYYKQSLQLYQEINDTGGLATSYSGLAYTALADDDYETARRNYAHALKLAAEIWYMAAFINLFLGIGQLLCRVGKQQDGLLLFALVQHHDATNQETKNRAAYLLDSFKLQVRPEELTVAIEAGQSADLEATVNALLVELPLLDLAGTTGSEAFELHVDPNQNLVEPLTARELEVLQLMAEGLTNREIADRLVLAEGTVKYYTRQIYGKLQVRNRVRAIATAQELGLV